MHLVLRIGAADEAGAKPGRTERAQQLAAIQINVHGALPVASRDGALRPRRGATGVCRASPASASPPASLCRAWRRVAAVTGPPTALRVPPACPAGAGRSEERRVGPEGVGSVRPRGRPT